MTKETVTLNAKEQKKLMVLNEVERGGLGAAGAAQMLGLTLRQVRRLLSAYRRKGACALAHGNRGRRPAHALDESVTQSVVGLSGTKYAGFNNCHLTEFLSEREGITLSVSSVRRIRLASGTSSPRKRRAPKHRSRRERYPRPGMLLQADGSDHDWLEGRGPRLTLIGAIDDATGEVVAALFRYEEDSHGYLLLLREIVSTHGIPAAVYHDRHSIFEVPSARRESIEEQLAGKREPTQVGRAMEELGITSIASHSPQARGRIERLWGTFQDRLVSELRLANACTLEEAEMVLQGLLPRHNLRFAIAPQSPESAYRQPDSSFNPETIFCFKYRRTVGADNVVRFGQERLQILPYGSRPSYAHARVEVHRLLDGSLAVYYQGECLPTTVAPPEASAARARTPTGQPPTTMVPTEQVPCSRPQRRPAADHPWRHYFRPNME